MDAIQAEHRIDIRVYAEDTDFMGIVFHGNYLNFFERARTEMLRNNGLSLTMMAGYDTHFAIREVQLQYHTAARLDDMLTITSQLNNIRASSAEFTQVMHNQLNILLCTATIQVVCVNQHLKPKRLPIEFFGGNKRG